MFLKKLRANYTIDLSSNKNESEQFILKCKSMDNLTGLRGDLWN